MGVGKYIAAALGLVLMIWTWDLATSDTGLKLEQRRELEVTLEEMIGQYIRAQKPEVTDIVFQQLFSEDVHSSVPGQQEMLVRFRYTTSEPAKSGETTEQVFEGSVRLRSKDGLNWEWIDETVRSPLIRYRNGTEVKSGTEPKGDPAK